MFCSIYYKNNKIWTLVHQKYLLSANSALDAEDTVCLDDILFLPPL